MVRRSPTIAATSTLAMVRLAEARGIPTADLLERAGLSRASLDDPDARIAAPTVLAVWEALRERAADPVLQLAAPAVLPFGAYQVIDYLVAASGTVGDGIRRFAGFFRLIAEAVSVDIDEGEHECRLTLELSDGGAVPPVYVSYVFAALVTRIRMRVRPHFRVALVEFRQPEPPASTAYAELFRSPVEFGAVADRLTFSRGEWDSPTDTGDAALAALLEQHARMLAGQVMAPDSAVSREVRDAIAAALPDGGSAAAVARALRISVRTLQRRLGAAGTTYREVSETVRRRLAEQYLANPGVSIGEVAFLLGFSDQSTFHRAFRRWTGEAPGRWRRGRRSAPGVHRPGRRGG